MPKSDAEARKRALKEIQDAMQVTGLKSSPLALAAGLQPSTLNRFLKDPEHCTVPSTTTLAKIAAVVRRHAKSAEPDEAEYRRMAKAQELAEAMGIRLPKQKVIKFADLLLQLGSRPEDTETLLDEMTRILRD